MTKKFTTFGLLLAVCLPLQAVRADKYFAGALMALMAYPNVVSQQKGLAAAKRERDESTLASLYMVGLHSGTAPAAVWHYSRQSNTVGHAHKRLQRARLGLNALIAILTPVSAVLGVLDSIGASDPPSDGGMLAFGDSRSLEFVYTIHF